MSWEWQNWLNLAHGPYESLPAIVTSLGIGLLIGVERERKKAPLAGIRTFPLLAMLGCLLGLIPVAAPLSGLLPTAGLLVVASLGFLPSGSKPEQEPRTTTVSALLIAYCLGLFCAQGWIELAVAIAIIATSLLYLKPELSGISQRLDRKDSLALLQFAALTFVVLPILPNHGFGPYAVLNPYRIWLLVVLIVGVGLAGYFAVRLLGEKVGTPILGIMGGMVSTTATSLVYARAAKENPASTVLAGKVILLANLVLFVRLILLTLAIAPAIINHALIMMLPPLILGLVSTFMHRNGSAHNAADAPQLQLSNPAELKLALGFAALFALVLIGTAWLMDLLGDRGVYIVALISGLNDVDAITLTVLDMASKGSLAINITLAAISIAVCSNTLFKFGLIASIGGRQLAMRCLPTFSAIVAGLILGLWLNQLLY